MLYLTTEHVFETFGGTVALPLVVVSASKIVSVTWKEELQMPGISTIAINKTLFVFANFWRWTLIMHKPDK